MTRGRGRMRALARLLAAVAAAPAALAVLSAGCGSGTSGAAARPTVLAAASLSEALRDVAPDARFSFAGSDQLAFQIRQGAPADVFAAASPRYPRELRREGLVREPRPFATNRLVLIVPRRNPAGIRSAADLSRPGTRLVVAEAGVPAGDYARAALARMGLSRALGNVVSNEADVRGVVAKVALGEADAGLCYATDVPAVAGRVRMLPLPARAQPVIEYHVAVVRSAPHPEAAREFVARLLSPAGRRALAARGFGPPPS